jgi:NAD(P)-dependent dehydrogenase (short-subunit alcohol dehydrogenase family)
MTASDDGRGQVALVTGASSGIGEATARRLRRSGFEVYAVARRVERMSGLADEGVHTFGMDVTDDETMVAGIERIMAEQGRLDVLVNNAGYGSYGSVEDVPIDEARRQFEVNLFGLARLCQLAIPQMRKQGSGRIINISSIGAVIYEPFGAWYHATKNAVEGFSDSLRVEVAQFGIDVVIVRPAGVVTEWNQISRESLVDVSRDGAYADQSVSAAKMLERVDNRLLSSGPDTVAKTILRAATAHRPGPRYASGRGAWMVPASRRLLPDRVFDAILSRAYLRES